KLWTESSNETKAFLLELFKDMKTPPFDVHAHAVCAGKTEDGLSCINAKYFIPSNFYYYVKMGIFKSALGIPSDLSMEKEPDKVNESIHNRHESLLKYMTPPDYPLAQSALFAFDPCYTKDGMLDEEHTEVIVPMKEVFQRVEESEHLYPVASIHPYAANAQERLLDYIARGGKVIKWLPSSQGMDPGDKEDMRITNFYRTMQENDMILLTHVGMEHSLPGFSKHEYCAPSRLELPLEMGVNVISAHVGCIGHDYHKDEDGSWQKEGEGDSKNSSSFHRVLGMMAKYPKLYADVSSLPLINRLQTIGHLLDLHIPENGDPELNVVKFQALVGSSEDITSLRVQSIVSRLLYGSDYPLPCLWGLNSTRKLVQAGYIDNRERSILNEVFRYNPLLYNFALMRTVQHPETGAKFLSEMFGKHPDLSFFDYEKYHQYKQRENR
ncbi:MAG: hypothetical protein ACI9S8_001821, partial [Chlamydiales bacterium]